jgi:hypothetical protein
MLAVIKTGTTNPSEPLIAVVKRASNGDYSLHTVAVGGTQDTRPIILVDTANDAAIVYRISNTGGGSVCSQSAPLATLAFTPDNCAPSPGCNLPPELFALGIADAPVFIGDTDTYCNINNPTSTKQMVTEDSGITVLASDEDDPEAEVPAHMVYVYNIVPGSTPPPPPPGDFNVYLPIVAK